MSKAPASSRRSDPRPERTRALLSEALLELIQEKRWDKIRVQDILDRTQVGRSTFYSHFDNKYELFTAAIPELAANIFAPDSNGAQLDLLPLFQHVEQVQPLLRPILTQSVFSDVIQTFHDQLKGSWIVHLEAVAVPESEHDLLGDVLAGALVAVVRHSVKAKRQPNAEQLSTQFTHYVEAVVAAASKGR